MGFHSQEFKRVLVLPKSLLDEIRNIQIFLTGGTGFFGKWFLESILWLNNEHSLNITATILTRNPEKFLKSYPKFSNKKSSLKFLKGDVRNFKYPDENYTHIIHGATTNAEETFIGQDPLIKFDTIVQGTRHILNLAEKCRVSRFLYISSGIAYGKQPSEISHLKEEYSGGPLTNDTNFDVSVLSEGKRTAELLTTIYQQKFGFNACIARCFSFVGPGLPLDIHYAAGNFIRDAINGQSIHIKGDGSPLRSYMYIADLIKWLWVILFMGKQGEIYNVGSDEQIMIKDLANIIASFFQPKPKIKIDHKKINSSKNIYVPDINKAKNELKLQLYTTLNDSIYNTILYNKNFNLQM